ncbi:hypothetical protein [Nakamurella aerolata]|uniref:Substrate-binding family protein n=1 Tax=Nakamurella aerolata TaxID=1656892 RepID=A0A849A8P3_9ACTN|nr:hypothetical protein [Nakamurella aerolata]NNG36895.1 hypothetical protein [Nakamurella aerolata]
MTLHTTGPATTASVAATATPPAGAATNGTAPAPTRTPATHTAGIQTPVTEAATQAATTETTETSTESSANAATPAVPEQVVNVAGQQGAFSRVGALLSGLPKARRVLIAGVNDGLVLGALGAARTAGRTDQVFLAGLGADQRSRCEIATDPQWIGDGAFFPDRYGQLVLPYLIDAMNGARIPRELYPRSVFLSAGTIAGHYDVSECTR